MPAAIDFATLAGISPRSDGKIVIYSENYSTEREFDAAALPASPASTGATIRWAWSRSWPAKATRFPASA